MTDARPPLFLFAGGDHQAFASIDALLRSVEPIDIVNNEYDVYDSRGAWVALRVTGRRIGFLASAEGTLEIRSVMASPDGPADLCARLSRALGDLGVRVEPGAALDALVATYVSRCGVTR